MTPEGFEPPTFGTGIRRATNCAMESVVLYISLNEIYIRTVMSVFNMYSINNNNNNNVIQYARFPSGPPPQY